MNCLLLLSVELCMGMIIFSLMLLLRWINYKHSENETFLVSDHCNNDTNYKCTANIIRFKFIIVIDLAYCKWCNIEEVACSSCSIAMC